MYHGIGSWCSGVLGRALQALHPRHQIGFRGFHQQMIVIAHQHVGVEAPAGPAAGLAERFQKAQAVPVIPIDRLSLIAPCHHMIGGSGIFNAQQPGHTGRIIPASPVPTQDPFTSFLGLAVSHTQTIRSKAAPRGHKPNSSGNRPVPGWPTGPAGCNNWSPTAWRPNRGYWSAPRRRRDVMSKCK